MKTKKAAALIVLAMGATLYFTHTTENRAKNRGERQIEEVVQDPKLAPALQAAVKVIREPAAAMTASRAKSPVSLEARSHFWEQAKKKMREASTPEEKCLIQITDIYSNTEIPDDQKKNQAFMVLSQAQLTPPQAQEVAYQILGLPLQGHSEQEKAHAYAEILGLLADWANTQPSVLEAAKKSYLEVLQTYPAYAETIWMNWHQGQPVTPEDLGILKQLATDPNCNCPWIKGYWESTEALSPPHQ